MIVGPQPAGRKVLHLSNAVEQVLTQPVIAHRSVVPLDVRILLRFTGLNVAYPNAASLGPGLQITADILWPAITAKGGRLATPFNDLFERAAYPVSGQRKIHLDLQTVPVEVIDHVEEPKTAMIG